MVPERKKVLNIEIEEEVGLRVARNWEKENSIVRGKEIKLRINYRKRQREEKQKPKIDDQGFGRGRSIKYLYYLQLGAHSKNLPAHPLFLGLRHQPLQKPPKMSSSCSGDTIVPSNIASKSRNSLSSIIKSHTLNENLSEKCLNGSRHNHTMSSSMWHSDFFVSQIGGDQSQVGDIRRDTVVMWYSISG